VLTLCSERGIRIDRTVTEIGSGRGGGRTELRKLLGDPTVSTIVVEHRDRLARFGVEYLEAALSAHGRTVVVLDQTEPAEDLARDLTEVLTCMCARLYGRRSAARRAVSAVAAIEAEPDSAPGDPS
jgi:putative resolvase